MSKTPPASRTPAGAGHSSHPRPLTAHEREEMAKAEWAAHLPVEEPGLNLSKARIAEEQNQFAAERAAKACYLGMDGTADKMTHALMNPVSVRDIMVDARGAAQSFAHSVEQDIQMVRHGGILDKLHGAADLTLTAASLFPLGRMGISGVRTVVPAVLRATTARLGMFSRSEGGAANLAAKNHISGLRLQHQLAQEEVATMFKANGELTDAAIQNSRRIPLNISNPQLKSTLSQRGNLADWGKYETAPVHTNNGLARVHYYHNPVTGEVYYGRDFKAIYDHQGKWDVDLQSNFSMQPGQ